MSRQVYNDRISEAKDLNLAVIESVLRINNDGHGLYERVADTWNALIRGWNFTDEDLAEGRE